MKHTLSVLVEDESGVLTRIAGLFAKRNFNIESLAVGSAEEEGKSRVTMVIDGDNQIIEQITKQLYKLINVLRVQNITNIRCTERELMLLKVKTNSCTRSKIIDIVNTFHAKTVDLAEFTITVEVTGDPEKIATIKKLLEVYGISEIARTGKIALIRDSNIDINSLRNYF